MSLLNRLGCVVMCVTRVRGLRGSKYFFTWFNTLPGHNFYVGCVGQTFCVGQFFGEWVQKNLDYHNNINISHIFSSVSYLSTKATSKCKLKEDISRFTVPSPQS